MSEATLSLKEFSYWAYNHPMSCLSSSLFLLSLVSPISYTAIPTPHSPQNLS
jgi:hypothetical protein